MKLNASPRRFLLAGLLAGLGTLSLHAADPLRGFDDGDRRRVPGAEPGAGPSAQAGRIRDRHLLRVTVTDGFAVLSGVTVTSGERSAVTNASGFAMLRADGWPSVPVTFVDSEGTSISGHIALPEGHSEGVDALVSIDGIAGTIDSVAAGETGSERAELAAAWSSLEDDWRAEGFKEDRPVETTFADAPAIQLPAPGTNAGSAGAPLGSLLVERQEVVDVVTGDLVLQSSVRRAASRVRGPQEASTLAVPTLETQKAGYELLVAHGLVVEDQLSPKAGATYEELLAVQALDDEQALLMGAELMRQGAALDPVIATAVQDAMAQSGLDFTIRTVHAAATAGGQVVVGLPGSAPVVNIVDGFEPDNTPGTCATIPADGTPQDRGIDPAGDMDFLCFNLACGDNVTIETGPIVAGGTGDTFIELFDPDGLLIVADDDGAATSNWSLVSTVADKTGTWVLKVRGFTTSTVVANYRVTVNATPGACDATPDDSEPNDTSAACSPKVPDGSYTSHHLRPLGDQDWFCFNVPTCGSSVVIDLNEPGDADITARIQLFSPSGVERLNTTSTTAQTVTVTEAGTFRVLVTGSTTPGTVPTHDNSVDNNTGVYDLSINITPPTLPCDSFEPDSEQAQCNSIAPTGVAVPGHSISPAGDEDWFCFDLGCNDTVSITVTPTPSGSTSLRPRVELWGPTSTAAITSLSGTVNGNPITLSRAANHAGRWYARVMRASTATGAVQTGTYNISVLATPVPSASCDSFEPDSHPDDCQPPADFAGTRQTKEIFPLRDEDWICLGTLACGDTVVVQTFPTIAGDATDTVVEIYKLPNFLLTTDDVAMDDDGGGSPYSRAVYSLTNVSQNGTYVAKVRGFSTTSTTTGLGRYDVSVTKTSDDCPEPDAFEPDNFQTDCNALDMSGAAVPGHNIYPASDTDFYCTTLTCGQNLSVTVQPTTASLRPIVAVLDSAGVVILSNTATAAGSPAQVSLTNLDAGDYFVRVTSSSSTQGGYTITATTGMGTCLFDPHEPDNTAATCRFTGMPMAESRAINPLNDSDYYCFVLDCGQGVSVTVTPTSGTLRAIIRLREQDGTTLTTVTASAAGETVTLTDAVALGGVYAIEIDQSSNTTGLYDISMSTFDGFACIDAFEPDNTRDACQPVATDGTVQVRTLLPHPDEDWACFEVPGCGYRITAATANPEPVYDAADTTIQLYDPDGAMIVSATTGSLTEVVDEPGTYAVRIIPASTTATSTSYGQYNLSVRVQDAKAELIVPPVVQTALPAATQLDAQALTPFSGDYAMIVGADPFIDISATGTHIDTGLISVVVPIGFDFEFYGNSYSDTAIHDNGLLSFSDPTWIPGIGNDCIPDAAAPNEFIAAFWEDLDGDFTYYQTIGAPGDRMFIAQWNDGYFPVTLQAILFEATNEISLRYGSMLGSGSDGTSATIGIENLAGEGIQYSCNTSSVASGMSISFIPDPGVTAIDYPENPSCYPQPSFYQVEADTAPFIDISATGTNLGTPTDFTDDSFRTHPLPIVFPYFGLGETVVHVGSNGFINFGTGSTSLSNQCGLPDSTAPNGVIAPFWDDLNPTTSGDIYGQLFGVPGSGTAFYVIQWNDVAFFSVGGSNTFEVILYESGLIEYRYGAMTASTRGSGDSATIGLEDRTGTNGITYGCNTAGTVFEGLRLSFTQAPPPEPVHRFKWLNPDTMELLGTGPTYLHPIDGICEVLLRVEVRDPTTCCDLSHEQLVTIPDRAAPAFVTQPSLGTDGCLFLWPPNHGYADFSLASTGVVVSDACDDAPIVRFSALSGSSQPEDESGVGDGGSLDDIMISPDGQTVSVRAERSANCDQLDRAYTLYIETVDASGNVRLSEPFGIGVYHDQGHQPPGPYRGAESGSDSDDTRPGWTEGSYGTGCGGGYSLDCDPTQVLR